MSLIRIVFALIVVAIAAGAALWLNCPDPAPKGLVNANGQIEARLIDIAAQRGGRVAEVAVTEGDLVQAGDLLVRLDSATLQAQKARAEASLAAAQSAVAAAEAHVAQAEARQRFARLELDRAQTLAERQVSPREQLDARQTELAVAQAELQAARAALVSRERSTEAERAAVAEIDSLIADGVLTAPRFARVLYRLAEPGEVVAQGQPVVVLVSVAELYMDVFLPAMAAPLVRIGDAARIRLDVMPDVAIPATVTFVSPQAQFTPREVETREERDSLMFRVRVAIPETLVRDRIEMVKTGVRGVAWLRLWQDGQAPDWPADLTPPQPLLDRMGTGQ